MSEVKWIKITTDIFDDEKIILIESMPDSYAIITVWFKLLCLAGKQNNSGVFLLNDKIPYTDEMLATIFRMNLNTVKLALETFRQFGMVELVEGVITIPNWNKHQSLDQLENRKEYMRNYMKKYREKQNLLVEKSQEEGLCKVYGKASVNVPDKELDKDKEKDRNNKTAEQVLSESDLDDRVKDCVREFIKMRKTIKAPMTERALTLMINKLREMSLDPEVEIAILNQSIENSWKGLYPLKKATWTSKKPNWDVNRENSDPYDMIARIAEGM